MENSVFRSKYLSLAFIVFASLLVYSNTLNAPFVLDDFPKIADNEEIKSPGTLAEKLVYPYGPGKSFYRNDPSRPVTTLTFALNYFAGGLNTSGYHLVNMLLHAANGVLVFILSAALLSCAGVSPAFPVPLLVSLLFTMHPVHASAVSYIYSRSDLLAFFFYVSGILFFMIPRNKHRFPGILAPACYMLALFSKQSAVTLPAVILLADFVFSGNEFRDNRLRRLLRHLPLWLILFSYLLFRYFYLGGIGDLEAKNAWDTAEYVIIMPYVLLRYLQLLLLPFGFAFDHYLEPSGIAGARTLLSSAFILLSAAAAVFFLRKASPVKKLLAFSAAWFFITLSPTSSIFPTASPLVENRLYLASFGFFLPLSLLYANVYRVYFPRRKRVIAAALIAAHILLLSFLTVKRNSLFLDHELLWKDTIRKYPRSVRARNMLGLTYNALGMHEKALSEFKKVVSLKPDIYKYHLNLGIIYTELSDYENALQEFRKTVKLNPYSDQAYKNMGTIYFNLGKHDMALKQYENAIMVNPGDSEAYRNIGSVYFSRKEYDRALEYIGRALELRPGYALARRDMGVIMHILGKYDKAIGHYSEALKLDPSDPRTHELMELSRKALINNK